jgi:hypothetical protein
LKIDVTLQSVSDNYLIIDCRTRTISSQTIITAFKIWGMHSDDGRRSVCSLITVIIGSDHRCHQVKGLENADQKEVKAIQSPVQGCENAAIETDDDRDSDAMSQRHRLKWATENGIGHSCTLKSGSY